MKEESSNSLNLWVEECFGDYVSLKFKVKNVLYREKSNFQTVSVVDTVGHGKMLLNDGLVMCSERDEFIYHDMIVHPAFYVHPNIQSVLVIGGGDGGTVRELCKYESVKYIDMVEIDKLVVDACLAHMPSISSKLKDSRVNLVFEDGVEFVKKTKNTYDLIIVDSSDPIGPATPLFNSGFYKDVYNCLSESGIVVSQCESVFYEKEMQAKMYSILKNQFSVCELYNYSNMCYPAGLWSFSFSSKKYHPTKDFIADKYLTKNIDYKYYNKDIHYGAFCLPQFQLDFLDSK